MMNIKRMGHLALWILTDNRHYFRRQLWMFIAICCLVMQIINVNFMSYGTHEHITNTVVVALTTVLLVTLIAGGSYMCMSLHDRKDSFRDLHMLPATNLEKYVVCFVVGFLAALFSYVVAILIGDALQIGIGLILGRPDVHMLTSDILNNMSHFNGTGPTKLLMAWLFSMFLLGANFFRNIKLNAILTAIVLLVLWILFMVTLPSTPMYYNGLTYNNGLRHAFLDSGDLGDMARHQLHVYMIVIYILLAVFTIFNVWMSYRLFCRRQLVAKFINT